MYAVYQSFSFWSQALSARIAPTTMESKTRQTLTKKEIRSKHPNTLLKLSTGQGPGKSVARSKRDPGVPYFTLSDLTLMAQTGVRQLFRLQTKRSIIFLDNGIVIHKRQKTMLGLCYHNWGIFQMTIITRRDAKPHGIARWRPDDSDGTTPKEMNFDKSPAFRLLFAFHVCKV